MDELRRGDRIKSNDTSWEIRTIEGRIGQYLAQQYQQYAEKESEDVQDQWNSVVRASKFIYPSLDSDTRLDDWAHAARTSQILMQCGLDIGCLSAALLHQCTKTSPESLDTLLSKYQKQAKGFPQAFQEVRELMVSIGKLRQALDSFLENRNEERAKNMVDKILDTIRVDLRPFLILLASRLDRLETRGDVDFKQRSKKEVAQETFLLFVPISHFLRLDRLTERFEDVLFMLAQGEDFERLKKWIGYDRRRLQVSLDYAATRLYAHLKNAEGFTLHEFESRVKHYHSAYLALLKRRQRGPYAHCMPPPIELEREKPIDDLLGVRLVVSTKEECDAARLECHKVLQQVGRPYQYDDRYKYDRGKPYHAIHDRFEVDNCLVLEIQIRDKDGHWDAEMGAATHWIYKYKEPPEIFGNDQILKILWKHWFERLRLFFQKNVIAMIDKGQIVVLETGATMLDMAYKLGILTDENYNLKATVLRRPNEMWPDGKSEKSVEPTEKLFTNWCVRLETQTPMWLYPPLAWLESPLCTETRRFMVQNLYVAPGGKGKVEIWVRSEISKQIQKEPEFYRELGLINDPQNVLDYLVEKGQCDTQDVCLQLAKGGEAQIKRAVTQLELAHKRDFGQKYKTHVKKKWEHFMMSLEKQGNSILRLSESRNKCEQCQGIIAKAPGSTPTGFISAVFGLCCCPLQGDDIIGIVTPISNPVLMVHRKKCQLCAGTDDETMTLSWIGYPEKGLLVGIEVAGFDRRGFAQDISRVFAENKVSIDHYNAIGLETFCERHEPRFAIFDLGLKLHSVSQLEKILRQLRKLNGVVAARRMMYPPEYRPRWR